MRNLYKSYVSQSTEQLLELRDNFLELRNKGLFVDFKEDATLQQVLLVERGIESKIGCLASYADRFVAKMIDWIIVSFIFIMIVITTLKNNFFISTIGLDLLLQIPLVAYILFADGLRGGQSIEKSSLVLQL